MRAAELIRESVTRLNETGDLLDACRNWYSMEYDVNDIRTILSHPLAKQFKQPPGITWLYRGISLSNNTIQGQRNFIPFATHINGAKAFLESLGAKSNSWAIYRKKLQPNTFILDFTRLYNSIEDKSMKINYQDEHEVWVKPTEYYTSVSEEDIVVSDAANIFENDEEHRAQLQKTGFWGAQAAGCIFLARDTGRYLIAHRSPHVQEPNTWGTWGGAIDAGEDPEQAVRREVQEEAGYHGKLLLKHLWTFKHPSGFQYHSYLAIVETEFAPRLDWETQGYAWVEKGRWPRPLHPGLAALLKNARLDESWRHGAMATAFGLGGLAGLQHGEPIRYEPFTPTLTAPQAVPAKTVEPPVQRKAEPEVPTQEPEQVQVNLGPAESLLVAKAKKAGIDGIELAQFLAQCSHETGGFKWLKEMGSRQYLQKRYDPAYSPARAKILGNVKPGDGVKYKGRGFIHLTGRYNYRKAGEALGLPLEEHPEMVEDPRVAALTAIWYWRTRVQPKVDDFTDVSSVTRRINPGMRGLEQRVAKFEKYSEIVDNL